MKRFIILALGAAVSFNVFAAEVFSVPTDSKASYTVLEKTRSGDMVTITTKREGPSGVSYSKRLYDCTASTVKYLGSGDTIEQMNSSAPDPNMAPIIDRSIAYYVGQKACR
ncbi:hypothetical protein PHL84_001411 [Salmonella enterica]|nr:hypothetical protein [Salmonella enterica subsp. enterica serovar Telhashomer]EAA8196216.1 hypothetical protein [Salmonella enterica]EBL1805480.1 hypothetical protein [Salmonella enterica subsp. enterica serovar Rubislaw]EBR7931717.1 hypothetical protein [Salmonella enterica subsp. enterica serovar Braenderup]EBS3817046.1 hypothetical protein [Salmonella enterica subsp. salamae serovar Sofia]EBX7333543.1 hypothetical protein [Salmonella enterica subsp. enterica serovar Sandiego]ECJ2852921.